MQRRENRRGAEENFVQHEHLKLGDLKKRAQGLGNRKLSKENIPDYPRPELHVTHLKHDTVQDGLRGIRGDEGFRNPYSIGLDSERLLWWSLAVGPDDIQEAERRLLEKTFPDRTEEQVQEQQGFLGKFATSPAFNWRSMFGSYRFTFPLQEVLEAYSEQFCSGRQPVMRVYETILYKQEVMYSVLVHSPDEEKFSIFPLLTDGPDSICSYKDGRFIWRPEAMCETHRYKLVRGDNERQMETERLSENKCEFYVWDHVALALHVGEQVLKFDAERLRQNLKFCKELPIKYPVANFDEFDDAEKVVKELWPDCPSPLERTTPLN